MPEGMKYDVLQAFTEKEIARPQKAMLSNQDVWNYIMYETSHFIHFLLCDKAIYIFFDISLYCVYKTGLLLFCIGLKGINYEYILLSFSCCQERRFSHLEQCKISIPTE